MNATSVAIAFGILGSAAGSGAGVSSSNKIGEQVVASINGDGTSGVQANHVSVTSMDTSTITSDAQSVTVAVSLAIGASGAVSIGTTISTNTINNDVEASIKNADTQVKSRAGDLVVDAEETASISTSAAAAAAAFALAPDSFAVSGAGVNSTNSITSTVAGFIQGSTNAVAPVEASGAVRVTANDTPKVSAVIVATSLTGGLFGVSAAAAVARNTEGETVSAYIDGSSVKADAGDVAVTATSSPTITTTSVASAITIALGGAGAGRFQPHDPDHHRGLRQRLHGHRHGP